jgi:hypothetical protein
MQDKVITAHPDGTLTTRFIDPEERAFRQASWQEQIEMFNALRALVRQQETLLSVAGLVFA